MPSAYLSLSQLPIARRTAGEAQFSLALRFSDARWSAGSLRMASAIRGSTSATTSRPAVKAPLVRLGAVGLGAAGLGAVVDMALLGGSREPRRAADVRRRGPLPGGGPPARCASAPVTVGGGGAAGRAGDSRTGLYRWGSTTQLSSWFASSRESRSLCIVVPPGPVEAGAMAPANPGAQRGRVLASDRNASASAGGRARARRTFPRLGGDSDRGGGVADRRVRLNRRTGWSGRTPSASSRAEEHPGRLCQRPDKWLAIGPPQPALQLSQIAAPRSLKYLSTSSPPAGRFTQAPVRRPNSNSAASGFPPWPLSGRGPSHRTNHACQHQDCRCFDPWATPGQSSYPTM